MVHAQLCHGAMVNMFHGASSGLRGTSTHDDFVGAVSTARFMHRETPQKEIASQFCRVDRCLNHAVVDAPTKSLEVLGSFPSGRNVDPIETSDRGDIPW